MPLHCLPWLLYDPGTTTSLRAVEYLVVGVVLPLVLSARVLKAVGSPFSSYGIVVYTPYRY